MQSFACFVMLHLQCILRSSPFTHLTGKLMVNPRAVYYILHASYSNPPGGNPTQFDNRK